MKKYLLYRIARPILTIFIKVFYKIEIINKDIIPVQGKCILAGNHTSNLDALSLIASTKRTIRFMAKKEMHKGVFGKLFISAGTIPVDRKNKDENARSLAINALNNEELLCIFPEGTINRTKETIMPFKYGTVSFAYKTNSMIIPFIIKGKYKILRKNIKLEFLNPYKLETDNLEKENNKLMNIIKNKLEEKNENDVV